MNLEKITNTIENIIITIIVIIFLWFLISFIDVNLHNMSDYQYADWNMFRIWEDGRCEY